MGTDIYLSLGSNLGDRVANLKKAVDAIGVSVGIVVQESSVYETAAWGKTDQPNYLNQVIKVSTALTPEETLQELLTIEAKLGRRRNEKWEARLIDIDILLFDDAVIETDVLKIPHPELANRRFVLQPFAEIAPNVMHPVLERKIIELLDQCADKLKVIKFMS